MSNSQDERLALLEGRLAHHERMAEELSDVLADQYRIIDMLSAQVRRLGRRLQDLEAGTERSPQDDRPPPHY